MRRTSECDMCDDVGLDTLKSASVVATERTVPSESKEKLTHESVRWSANCKRFVEDLLSRGKKGEECLQTLVDTTADFIRGTDDIGSVDVLGLLWHWSEDDFLRRDLAKVIARSNAKKHKEVAEAIGKALPKVDTSLECKRQKKADLPTASARFVREMVPFLHIDEAEFYEDVFGAADDKCTFEHTCAWLCSLPREALAKFSFHSCFELPITGWKTVLLPAQRFAAIGDVVYFFAANESLLRNALQFVGSKSSTRQFADATVRQRIALFAEFASHFEDTSVNLWNFANDFDFCVELLPVLNAVMDSGTLLKTLTTDSGTVPKQWIEDDLQRAFDERWEKESFLETFGDQMPDKIKFHWNGFHSPMRFALSNDSEWPGVDSSAQLCRLLPAFDKHFDEHSFWQRTDALRFCNVKLLAFLFPLIAAHDLDTAPLTAVGAFSLPASVRLVEVGPRDGLQSEASELSVETKVELIDRLAQCGACDIECGAFVSPKWVPQMANSAEVMRRVAALKAANGYTFRTSALVPNLFGLETALRELGVARLEQVSVFAAASESFSKANSNCTIDRALARLRPVCDLATANGIAVRGYVACAMGCPFEGAVQPSAVVRVAKALEQMGCSELSVADTIGSGTPKLVHSVLSQVIGSGISVHKLAVHFHDTYGQALANILTALATGVSVVDCSVSGLGGCPFAGGKATGNVATEDLVYLLHGMGVETGLSLDKLVETAQWISAKLEKPTCSSVTAARTQKKTTAGCSVTSPL